MTIIWRAGDTEGVFFFGIILCTFIHCSTFQKLNHVSFYENSKVIFLKKKQVTKIFSLVSSKLDLCLRTSGFKSQHTAEIMCQEAISLWRLVAATWEEITHRERERERREEKQAQNWGALPLSEDKLA